MSPVVLLSVLHSQRHGDVLHVNGCCGFSVAYTKLTHFSLQAAGKEQCEFSVIPSQKCERKIKIVSLESYCSQILEEMRRIQDLVHFIGSKQNLKNSEQC